MSFNSHSRGPGGLPCPAGGNARSANVAGVPSTSRTGRNMFRLMCSAMWTLNIADPYAFNPELLTISNPAQPASQHRVCAGGQRSPRLRSRSTPAR